MQVMLGTLSAVQASPYQPTYKRTMPVTSMLIKILQRWLTWGSIFGPKSYEVIWKQEEKHMVWKLSYDLLSLENSCFHMTDAFSYDFIWLQLILKEEDSSCFLYYFLSHMLVKCKQNWNEIYMFLYLILQIFITLGSCTVLYPRTKEYILYFLWLYQLVPYLTTYYVSILANKKRSQQLCYIRFERENISTVEALRNSSKCGCMLHVNPPTGHYC